MYNLITRPPPSFVCGDAYSICINDSGDVYSFGDNSSGQTGHKEEIHIPKKISYLKFIKEITCGTKHSLFLSDSGNVYTCGDNAYGQIGINPTTIDKIYKPKQILNIPSIKHIKSGLFFNLLLSYDNIIYSFGDNAKGQLGHGSISSRSLHIPTIISDFYDIDFIECGRDFVICKNTNDIFYSWGNGSVGQLGHENNYNNYSTPKQVETNWPDDIISIKCGSTHSLFLTSQNILYGCGENGFGQLGELHSQKTSSPCIIPNLPPIIKIDCGNYHTMCIDNEYNLWTFGYNTYGQLGIGTKSDKQEPTKLSNIKDIIDISHSGFHSFVKTSNNQIYAFGCGDHCQLGNNNKINILSPQLMDYNNIWTTNICNSRKKSARK